MTQTVAQTPNLKQYPAISFKKCVLFNHEKTISQLIFNKSEELMANPTIKRCLDMHYKDEKQKVLTFIASVVMVKIATKILHMNRSLALSAPRNWTSTLFKYIFIPYMISTYKYVKDIKRTIMEIESQIVEDPEADQLWQPIFQQKYPDLNQPLYSSPFTRFKLEDVVKDCSRVDSLV